MAESSASCIKSREQHVILTMLPRKRQESAVQDADASVIAFVLRGPTLAASPACLPVEGLRLQYFSAGAMIHVSITAGTFNLL